VVDFYRNVMRVLPTGRVRDVLVLLKAVHAR
jgi:hypothetical protein